MPLNLVIESNDLQHYLEETEEADWSHLAVREKAAELFQASENELGFVQRAFEFVRDEIAHSWDIQSRRVTRRASEALFFREGICYAKSNLLCALLRSQGVPAGYCYQRLTLGDTPDTGYCIHALNAVYLKSEGRWIRLDARGNKAGVDAQFSLTEEKLAFPVREEYEEADYPVVYARPNPGTMDTLKRHTDCVEMYRHGLPASL